jgi:hypothetical protein
VIEGIGTRDDRTQEALVFPQADLDDMLHASTKHKRGEAASLPDWWSRLEQMTGMQLVEFICEDQRLVEAVREEEALTCVLAITPQGCGA